MQHLFSAVFYLGTLLYSLPAVHAQLSQGPNSPVSAAGTNCPLAFGGGPFTSAVSNALTSNNSYVTFTHCACCDANTQCLEVTDFGFSIPGGNGICGIRVEVERGTSTAFNSSTEDNGLQLMKGGAVTGANRAANGVSWPTVDAYRTYGGSSQ